MIKKISLLLASLIMAVSAVWAGTDTYTATVTYPSNPSVNSNYYVYYGPGTTFTATLSGVGGGGGAAYAIANGQTMCIANSGGGPGTPIYASNSCTLSYGQGVNISLNGTVSTSGAYVTATVVATW